MARGMSLAEILLALGLFAVVALVFMGLTITGISQTEKGELHALGASVAEAELEALKARPYSELSELIGAAPVPHERVWDGYPFELLATVEPFPAGPSDPGGRSLLLRVEARWTERTGLETGGGRLEREGSYELTGVATPGVSL